MNKLIIWWTILLISAVLVVLIKEILVPFIISLMISYLLNPLVDKLSKINVPRYLSASAIILLFFSLILAFIIFLVPPLYSQFLTVLHVLPQYLSFLQSKVHSEFLGGESKIEYGSLLFEKYSSEFTTIISKFVQNIWSSTIAVVNILSLIFITPVITFYTLRDWPVILNSINKLMPVKHHSVITERVNEIDETLSAYIRGQTQVCLILGLFYSLFLSLAGLQYALFIGLFTGIFSFIPYISFGIGFAMGNIVSLFQYDSFLMHGIILLIFIVGQILESSIIVPKLIGDNVKLHPVWVIFAIFAGGAICGFIGILIALPVAAIIGVLVRFLLQIYFNSDLYEATKLTK